MLTAAGFFFGLGMGCNWIYLSMTRWPKQFGWSDYIQALFNLATGTAFGALLDFLFSLKGS